MPFAGYKTFAQCVQEKSRDPKVYSPGGLCHVIEQRATHGRRRNPSPSKVAELIQVGRTKSGWDVIEYVDADDQIKIGKRVFAPGVRMVLKGKEKGPFSIGYALFERKPNIGWRWVHSVRYIKGKFNLQKETLSLPNHLSPAEKTLGQMADILLTWVVQEREAHG